MGNVLNDHIPNIAAWSEDVTLTIIHEIGHMLGLYHPWQNSEDPHTQDKVDINASCIINGEPCETDPTITGDRMVSTPPDLGETQVWIDCAGNVSTTAGVDACGTPYSNLPANDEIPTNYMAGTAHDDCANKKFTPEQIDRMMGFIALGPTGSLPCNPDPIVGFESGGVISSQTVTFTNQTLTLGSSFILDGGGLILEGCTVIVPDGKNIQLKNGSVLIVRNSSIIEDGASSGCELLDFQNDGLIRSQGNQRNDVLITDGSYIEGAEPIKSGFSRSAYLFCEVFRSDIVSTDQYAVQISNGVLNAYDNTSFTGAVSIEERDFAAEDIQLICRNTSFFKSPNQGNLGISVGVPLGGGTGGYGQPT